MSFIPSTSSRASAHAVTGDREAYQYLVESIRKFPKPPGLRQDDRGRRFPPRLLHQHDRPAWWRCIRAGNCDRRHLLISRVWRAPVLCSRAKACSRWSTRAHCRCRRRPRIAIARLFERPTAKDGSGRLAAALTKLGPTYVKLGQFMATRPDVVGKQIARDLESLQDKMAPFPQSEAEAAVAAAFDKPLKDVFAVFGPAVAAASIAQVHRAEVESDGVRKAGGGENPAARHRAPLQGRSRRVLLRRAQGGKPVARGATAAPGRSGGDARPFGGDRNGFSAGGRRALRDGGEHAQGRRISACRRSTGTAPRAKC